MIHVTSMVPGIRWPAIPSPRASQLLAMQFQLEQSQWLPPLQLLEQQQQQLRALLPFAYETVPFYRSRFDSAGVSLTKEFGEDQWRQIPLLTRADIQRDGNAIRSRARLKEHGPRAQSVTSGSSGSPVVTWGTTVTRLMWSALTLRQHVWHNRDLRGKLAAIRSRAEKSDDSRPSAADKSWGAATMDVTQTGPSVRLDIHTPVDEQAEWLVSEEPDYLITYPTNAEALARHFIRLGLRLNRLREVRTFGELLEPSVRPACRQAWDVPVVDAYSSQELGYIALQCPKHEHYHVQSESVFVEILDENGRPCRPGEVGRVVITSLLNFAMPLIRYDIGDFAEVGDVCDCGRGLPVLRRIVGRQRNMAVLPDGRRIWPALDLIGNNELVNLPPIQQFQLVQKTLHEMELRLVTPVPLAPIAEETVRRWVDMALGHPFDTTIKYVTSIPRSEGGKFEEFRCEVESPTV